MVARYDPGRLHAAAAQGWDGVLRAKGFFWLATRNDLAGEWSQAGRVLTVGAAGPWLAAVDRREREAYLQEVGLAAVPDWEAPYGDRRQELVFIGSDMDRAELTNRLDACLLTDAELRVGPSSWVAFEDPFPSWEFIGDEDHGDHDPSVAAFDVRATGDPTDPRAA
ncbi:MAG: GTP-binding protein [Patulibacter sp.]|nr:GTP-binding protein [Patulibacter sp.]